LFDGIPNGDMLVGLLILYKSSCGQCRAFCFLILMSMSGLLQDGTQVQLKSVGLQKYVSAIGGGGGNVPVNQDVASTWVTFKVCSLPVAVTA
jgi:hypothetical protein